MNFGIEAIRYAGGGGGLVFRDISHKLPIGMGNMGASLSTFANILEFRTPTFSHINGADIQYKTHTSSLTALMFGRAPPSTV